MAIDNQFKIKVNVIDHHQPDQQIKQETQDDLFNSPDVSSDEQTADQVMIIDEQTDFKDNEIKPMKTKQAKKKWKPTKKQTIIGLCTLIVLLIGGFFVYQNVFKTNKTVSVAVHKIYVAPKPTTVASNLTGLQVNPSLNNIPVTAIMVENSIDARPQSGLSDAGVVFEAVAEGGVTRFMALYQDTSPTNVGPIRSARPYYVAWALGFDAGYAHVGGSPDALADIPAWNVRDLNQFYNGNYYHRITTRQAPHNVYTGVATLNQLESSKGYNSSKYTPWTRKPEAPAKIPTATNISFSISGPVYNPSYTYVPSTNSYNRTMDGAPHIDSNNNKQISPKVVIGLVIPESQGALDSSGAYYSDYSFIGSGQADIFQDGLVTIGQWTKSSNSSQIMFTDANSKPIALNPGQTWISAVTSPSNISYSH